MPPKNPTKLLETALELARAELKRDRGKQYLNKLSTTLRSQIKTIAKEAEKQKAVLSVLITSLVKKLHDPSQDVRYHKKELPGGYSGRTFDTKYVTPFLKSHFPRLAMKESGWLTRSLEQAQPYTLDYRGKIQEKKVKAAFLGILNKLEEEKANSEHLLVSLLILLLKDFHKSQKALKQIALVKELSIKDIVECFEEHFFINYGAHGASRLPVLALYSIYEFLVEELPRYKGKKLLPLESHLAPDTKAKRLGDIDVVYDEIGPFECIEVKHGKAITAADVDDAYTKFKELSVRRYYILTTAEPDVKSNERKKVDTLVSKIKRDHGCEVIVNGLIKSLKYYLRLLPKPSLVLERYTRNLQQEFENTTVVKKVHVEKWSEIIQKVST